eukprot:4472630-Prymnesium_polylepis.1
MRSGSVGSVLAAVPPAVPAPAGAQPAHAEGVQPVSASPVDATRRRRAERRADSDTAERSGGVQSFVKPVGGAEEG